MEDEPKNEYCPEWGYRQHLHTRHAGWTTFIIPKGFVWARIGPHEVMIYEPERARNARDAKHWADPITEFARNIARVPTGADALQQGE